MTKHQVASAITLAALAAQTQIAYKREPAARSFDREDAALRRQIVCETCKRANVTLFRFGPVYFCKSDLRDANCDE